MIETQEMIAILALVIVAVFVIVVGFDCIKDGMCDIGAVIHDIIAAPVRHYRQKKLMEQMEREWENYLEKNRAKMVRNLMKEQQRHFSTSIGEKHTVEEWGKALEEFAEYQCQQDKEERTWQEENLKRLEEFHQVSKKNRYRKCLVTCSEKNPKGRTRKVQRKALFHKWDEIKQVIDASPMIGGHPGGQIAYTLGIVEFMDGTVGQVSPGYIKFLDTEDFAGDCNE